MQLSGEATDAARVDDDARLPWSLPQDHATGAVVARLAATEHAAQLSRPEDEGIVELPVDSPRTPTSRAERGRHELVLDVPVLDVADAGASWVVLFGILLHRYSAQTEILIAPRWRLTTEGNALDVVRSAAVIHAVRSNVALTLLGPGETPSASTVDLELVVDSDRRHAVLVFDAQLFRRSTIARVAGHLAVLAHAIAASPASAISALPLMTCEERAALDAVCEGARAVLDDEPLHHVVAGHARATPDAIAVRHRDAHLTYAALDQRANQLARLLVARGIGAEDRVLVCLDPSLDIAVALLGVLKAGAVYVPLEPTYPRERIAAIVEDTRPRLVLSQTHLVERLALSAQPIFAFDRDSLDGHSTADPAVQIDPGQTAYVYYTSGTTGKPKGVMASHANLVFYIQSAQRRYDWSPTDVSPAIARFSFSISMFELMSPLVAGGTLLVLDREHVLDPARLARTLSEVTFFHAGPSLLRGLLAHIREAYRDVSCFDGVRHASSGGDLIAPEVLEGLKQTFGKAEVFVIYGCSEIACMGCTYPVSRDRPVSRTYVGRPFVNTTVRVLDPARNLVPVGVTGEVYFSGDGVVKGYLDRPQLTAQKFVDVGGRRFYMTGDVGRMSEDGWLELVGRNDFQIKLRGMRIELGDVEHTLRRAPSVRDGVVVARPGPNGDPTLVAYVVLRDAETASTVPAIRRHMTNALPDYMVPPTYVVLEAMPLNHNMKLDRRALPDPPRADQRTAQELRAPESPSELALARMWTSLLNLPRVGLDDNFFQLGADSLIATRLVADVRRALGVELDGMDVLRESLEVLAVICDRTLGLASPIREPRLVAPRAHVTGFHFGPAERLRGVLHEPIGARRDLAVLVAAPLGQERVRTHFLFSSLGEQLAARGVTMLQLDYTGTWDSLGDTIDADLTRWRRDLALGHAELVRRMGTTNIAGVGVRLGATLLGDAGVPLTRLVAWDPILDGAAYYEELSAMHRSQLAAMQHLRFGRTPLCYPGAEELLGSTYSAWMLRELRALRFRATAPLAWLATTDETRQRTHAARLGATRTETLEIDCGWRDCSRLDEILPDSGITRALLSLLGESA